MPRYFLVPKLYKRLKELGVVFVCKICGEALEYYDEVESKVSGKGPKMYHAECYDASFLDTEYTEESLKAIYEDEGREGLESIMWEFGENAPEELSDEGLIAHILVLEGKYRASDENP